MFRGALLPVKVDFEVLPTSAQDSDIAQSPKMKPVESNENRNQDEEKVLKETNVNDTEEVETKDGETETTDSGKQNEEAQG